MENFFDTLRVVEEKRSIERSLGKLEVSRQNFSLLVECICVYVCMCTGEKI